MAFDIRQARETDDLRPLWETAFLPDEAFFSRDYRPEQALIVTDSQKPVSMLHILPRSLRLGDAVYKAGYIMGVATDPACRRQGLAAQLLKQAVKTIEEEEYDCAMLIPASAELARYYAKFGLTMRGSMPVAESEPLYSPRRASNNDIPVLSAWYNEAFPHRAERDGYEWETILLGYTVMIGLNGYTAGDERGLLERVPVPPGTPDCERAACIKPFTAGIQPPPYINLLYT
ncbi:MAG: GNAT family N-acetyltransferase [Oscillospiraceae bacterium]|nr:GNAT family N-acetyltransferase [Oscillospiraceae bacterium]